LAAAHHGCSLRPPLSCAGPFGRMAEAIASRQAVADAGGSGAELTHEAWALTGSWLLPGEKAGFSGPGAPAATFSPSAGDWGAFELVGRIAELRTDREDETTFFSRVQIAY